MSALNDLFTGKDNKTHDLGRWSWFTSIAAVVGAAFWNAYHAAGMINLMEFSQAIGVIVGVHGAALWAKKDTEPEKKEGE